MHCVCTIYSVEYLCRYTHIPLSTMSTMVLEHTHRSTHSPYIIQFKLIEIVRNGKCILYVCVCDISTPVCVCVFRTVRKKKFEHVEMEREKMEHILIGSAFFINLYKQRLSLLLILPLSF